ncbi:16S rRNA (guanine(527)-N(7))-methyltransferase RsmG [bacterium]|nr:16S rRNA (guanine(527)-N(7))-methyltransferase RsmG [bacterium]
MNKGPYKSSSASKRHKDSDSRKPSGTPKRSRYKKIKTSPPPIIDPTHVVPISSANVQKELDKLEHKFSDEQFSLFVDYLILVRELNGEINLVSRKNAEEVLLSSLYESLAPIKNDSWKGGSSLLDIGTGGGFPGIPLAIAMPDVQFTLLDSRRAKIIALKKIISEISLDNVEVLHDRAEILADHSENRYDIATVRAVGALREVTPWVGGLLNPGGKLLAWKGPEGMREKNEMDKTRWELIKRISIQKHRYVMVFKYVVPD